MNRMQNLVENEFLIWSLHENKNKFQPEFELILGNSRNNLQMHDTHLPFLSLSPIVPIAKRDTLFLGDIQINELTQLYDMCEEYLFVKFYVHPS